MRDKLQQSFKRFLMLPEYLKQPSRSAATQTNPRFEIRRMRATSLGYPDEADLEAVVYLSHNNARIRRANPDLTLLKRAALYTLWFQCNTKAFALLERIPPDKNGVSVVGNTAILPLQQLTMNRIANQELAVINLRQPDICPAETSCEVLLFDTWVLHNDYQESSWLGGRANRHFGYGNALVLRHLAMFWNAHSNVPLSLYSEPDARGMQDLLSDLGFEPRGETQIGEPLYELNYPTTKPVNLENALQRRYLHELVVKIDECQSW